jgi:hypothetical protein
MGMNGEIVKNTRLSCDMDVLANVQRQQKGSVFTKFIFLSSASVCS